MTTPPKLAALWPAAPLKVGGDDGVGVGVTFNEVGIVVGFAVGAVPVGATDEQYTVV
jgi:hypothetical protein